MRTEIPCQSEITSLVTLTAPQAARPTHLTPHYPYT